MMPVVGQCVVLQRVTCRHVCDSVKSCKDYCSTPVTRCSYFIVMLSATAIAEGRFLRHKAHRWQSSVITWNRNKARYHKNDVKLTCMPTASADRLLSKVCVGF